MKLLQAAIATAGDMGVPQCISIVDAGWHLLAFARMDGAFFAIDRYLLTKAKTAASYRKPTGDRCGVDLKLAIATEANASICPGVPIIVDSHVSVASGRIGHHREQDRQVAKAALAALAGARCFD
jgi:uncharacterized protein GlcG (DUF336 family)